MIISGKKMIPTVVILFSLILLISGCGGSSGSGGGNNAYTSIEQLNGKNVGIQSGTAFAPFVEEILEDPHILYYNTYSDLITALEAGKIDCFPMTESTTRMSMAENPHLTTLECETETYDSGFLFSKTETGEVIRTQFDEFLTRIKDDGTFDEMCSVWFGIDEDMKVIPDTDMLPATNGELIFGTEGEYPPFNYVRDSQIVGLEVDLAVRFCMEYGYGLDITCMSFDSLLPAVQTGKIDFAASGMTITEERAQSVNFSIPYYTDTTVMVVLKEDTDTGESFFDSFKSSFHKTFIREDRYKMFLQGILVTLFITMMSIIFGTALGFVAYLWCRKGNPAANAITSFMIWLIQGMPMVVLLMILYYVIFGNVAIDGIWIAVIGFTLTFGSAVFGMLRSGVNAVDQGQTEASYALGFNDNQTFFGIILPQAARFFMPAYMGEIVSLIKATAIVGYVAVQDLTKMGDLVRSRTYEAFFPLISVAVIYFVLAWIVQTIVESITIGTDPSKRSREKILKGVKTDDRNS